MSRRRDAARVRAERPPNSRNASRGESCRARRTLARAASVCKPRSCPAQRRRGCGRPCRRRRFVTVVLVGAAQHPQNPAAPRKVPLLPNLDKAQPRRSGAELTYVKSWVRVTVPRRRSNHWDSCPTRRARWGCWSGYCFLRHPASWTAGGGCCRTHQLGPKWTGWRWSWFRQRRRSSQLPCWDWRRWDSALANPAHPEHLAVRRHLCRGLRSSADQSARSAAVLRVAGTA